MPVWPDIVVVKPDSPEILLAIEVKAGESAGNGVEQIKSYMVHQSCPLGMLVTPQETLFFRNRYIAYEPETIQQIGFCRTNEMLGAKPDETPITEGYLVRRVEEWLEALQLGGRRSWPPSATEAIELCVLPVVTGGVIRAAGPRWRRTGS